MNSIYFALVLITLVGVSLVNGQCDGPPAWKIPEACCNFNLIEQSVLKGCKRDHHGGGGGHHGGGGGKHKPVDLLTGSCLIECAFNATGLFNGALVEGQLRSVFTNAVSTNPGLTTALNNALTRCLPIARTRTAEFIAKLPTTEQLQCNPISTILFACVTTNLVANCPAADFHADDPTCVTMQTYYRQCPNGPQ